eukprot:TRINITY_DN64880_c0_g1_i1.p1 TRINITY_DN64880_c0_g1~~TRINITY_DN64880_c0_g1_i1.p1  ORF type:complete len:143 (+),score=30.13 TRINITY_DN64880_c0_g1_i1:43-429(+)
MSWQGYIDNFDKAGMAASAVIGLPNAVWAKSKDFNMSADEINKLVSGFATPSPLSGTGVHAGGTKYICTKANDEEVHGQLKQNDEVKGIYAHKTAKCVVVGIHNKNLQGGQANNIVATTANHLKNAGF